MSGKGQRQPSHDLQVRQTMVDLSKGQQIGTRLTRHRCKPGLLRMALSRLNSRPCRSSALLGLPVEVLTQLLRLVPPDTLLVISETCVVLRRLSHTIREGRGLSRSEYLRYLTTLVRDKPGVWVCQKCMEVRNLSINDAPSSPTLPQECLIRGSGHESQQAVCRRFILFDRHVQSALKYSRLCAGHGSQQRGQQARDILELRLGRIMAPYRTIYRTSPLYREHTAEHTVFPKIVQGHFLIRVTWNFPTQSDHEESYTMRAMGFLRICRHQGFLYTGDKTINDQEKSLQAAKRQMSLKEQNTSRISSVQPWLEAQPSIASLNKLPAALKEAREACGKEIQCFCNACPSDFTVVVGKTSTTIRLWQDLGREGPPINLPRIPEKLRGGPSNPLGFTDLTHVPGSVRGRFEGRCFSHCPTYRM